MKILLIFAMANFALAVDCLKPGDILIRVNGVKVTEENSKKAYQILGRSRKANVLIKRDGKRKQIICGGDEGEK